MAMNLDYIAAHPEVKRVQGTSAGACTSKRPKAVHPVLGRGQSSTGFSGRGLRERYGRQRRTSERGQCLRLEIYRTFA